MEKVIVLGIDREHVARAVKLEVDNDKNIEKFFESKGWTNIVIMQTEKGVFSYE